METVLVSLAELDWGKTPLVIFSSSVAACVSVYGFVLFRLWIAYKTPNVVVLKFGPQDRPILDLWAGALLLTFTLFFLVWAIGDSYNVAWLRWLFAAANVGYAGFLVATGEVTVR